MYVVHVPTHTCVLRYVILYVTSTCDLFMVDIFTYYLVGVPFLECNASPTVYNTTKQ